ncbi:hypothetical protein ACJRO7_023021 [Eucalyptus globulus]|uniref:Bifunctional inhibitor/plant lipid transfer protein/seed storage helical domain-containing protein n=1 Tax=Eucalyptus globulus TaxID=34317 RepID=A0ABD3K1K1_EUCGL
MAKLAILGAILGALLVMSRAVTANRATITTVNVDEPENQGRRGGSCYEQVQRQGLEHCEQLFEDAMMYGGQGGQGGQGECMSEMMQSRHFRPCCQQLRQMDDRCRCEGVRQVVRQQMGEIRGQGSQGMMRCASNLPNMCGFGPQHCDIRAISY